MTITFSSDPDLKSLRHVSIRNRRTRELELLPMPTAEEAEAWRMRDTKYCSRKSGWKPNYDDGVEARRDAAKQELDQQARKRLANKPVTFLEEMAAVKVRAPRPSTDAQRVVADLVRADPQELSWSHIFRLVPAAQILKWAQQAASSPDPVFAWNLQVKMAEPRNTSPFRYHAGAYYKADISDFHQLAAPARHTKESRNPEITRWMQAAEANQLLGRDLRCAITGKSLVTKTSYFGRHSWRISPTYNGMTLEAAQQVASAVAIEAGIVKGRIRGTAPPLVRQLQENTSEWLGLIVATKHPVFYATALELLRHKRSISFTDNKEANRVEWESAIGATLVGSSTPAG